MVTNRRIANPMSIQIITFHSPITKNLYHIIMTHNGTLLIISQLDWPEFLKVVVFMKEWSKEMRIMNNYMKGVDSVDTFKMMEIGIT